MHSAFDPRMVVGKRTWIFFFNVLDKKKKNHTAVLCYYFLTGGFI